MLTRLLSGLLCSGVAFAAAVSAAPVLAYSTYLRDGFTPHAITTDSAGNIYLAGTVLIDPAANQSTALVMKLNPQATQYLYVRYLGGSVSDSANAIAVDSAGNAYIAGQTDSPDFPVTPGGQLGATPNGFTPLASGPTSFVTKLDPTGDIVFSDLLGGTAFSEAQAVAVTPAGQVIVSGLIWTPGFPTTPGAYSVSDSSGGPYLLELDPIGTKLVFSATGIGGSAMVLDSSGNIYVAGTTTRLDYPTTPGAYQSTFPAFITCFFPCQLGFQGSNQYVTKVDPTGAKLIYSTSLSGGGNTFNAGLAVDTAGNAYVTGFAGVGYPYTVTAPGYPNPRGVMTYVPALPFLSKLDPAGQNLLFSVPAGGAGIQLDAAGTVYVGGIVGYGSGPVASYAIPSSLPALADVPGQCLPNGLLIRNSAYVSQADGTSGNLLGTQLIGGSSVNPAGIALGASAVWIAGATAAPDIPFTSGALAPDFLDGPNLGSGAYLGGVDFSQPQPPAGTPQIGCLLDAADFSPEGGGAPYQILAMFGTGLGPTAGVNAPDNATTTLAGVSVTVGNLPAILLFVSSTQINFAVPPVDYLNPLAALQVTVHGQVSNARALDLDYGTPHLFINAAATYQDPNNLNDLFVPYALNADGSLNSSSNPAPPGATVSVFINGLAPNPQVTTAPLELNATGGFMVEKATLISPFVWRADVLPPSISVNSLFSVPCLNCGCTQTLCNAALVLSTGGLTVHPLDGATVWMKPD